MCQSHGWPFRPHTTPRCVRRLGKHILLWTQPQKGGQLTAVWLFAFNARERPSSPGDNQDNHGSLCRRRRKLVSPLLRGDESTAGHSAGLQAKGRCLCASSPILPPLRSVSAPVHPEAGRSPSRADLSISRYIFKTTTTVSAPPPTSASEQGWSLLSSPPRQAAGISDHTWNPAYFRCTAHPRAAITGPDSEAGSSDVSEFQGDDWMETFTSDHLSHTNYHGWQSGNYLNSNSKSCAIKFVITVAFNYGKQGPECRKCAEGKKWVSVSILILNQVVSFGKLF